MPLMITSKELAQVVKCSKRSINRRIKNGTLPAVKVEQGNVLSYQIPVDTLPEDLKAAYYASLKPEDQKPTYVPTPAPERSLEEMSDAEREQYAYWTQLIDKWRAFRDEFDGTFEQADEAFELAMKDEPHPISRQILYRKDRELRSGNPYAVVDRRGGHNRGQTSIPAPAWDWFYSQWMTQSRLSVTFCRQATINWCKLHRPDLLDQIPSESAFRRKTQKIPYPERVLCREGNKAFYDKCQEYIRRIYDDLLPNQVWFADNHTLDIMSRREDGSERPHRLYLTAFSDAYSGVIVGWYITDAPSSQSTIYALRHAIMRFGIPNEVWLDNGSEFLTHDVGGRGHRSRKSQEGQLTPPPIFARLGIHMVNALVQNARAKVIERSFYTFKEQISKLFETFTGGSPDTRPERLTEVLKTKRVPLDGDLRETLADLIDGQYNCGIYGGAITKNRGRTRLECWNQNIRNQRVALEEDLNLMLLRTERPRKVTRNGVYLKIAGEKIFYHADDTWKIQEQLVYLRYDPEDISSVRVYEAETDRYIATWPMSTKTMIAFRAGREEIAQGMQAIRMTKKAIREQVKEQKNRVAAAERMDILDVQRWAAKEAKEGMAIIRPKILTPVRAEEPAKEPIAAAVGIETVDIDLSRMTANRAKREQARRRWSNDV